MKRKRKVGKKIREINSTDPRKTSRTSGGEETGNETISGKGKEKQK